MDDFEKEMLGVQAYRLSEVTNSEFKSALLHFRKAVGGMWRIPDFCFDIGVIAGMATAMFFNQFWVKLFGIAICLFGASQIGMRMGNRDSFQVGYERGKQAGACRALGIPEGEDAELLKKARQQIVEVKAGSAEPSLDVSGGNR